MAAQAIPVTPEVVRWAINEDGRPLGELAQVLRVDVDTIDGWTTGDAQPTGTEFSRLSEVLQRPRALFFLPRPPAAASLPANFRHPPGDDRNVGATARRRLREARRIQSAIAWIRREDPTSSLPRAAIDDSPDDAASRMRDWLGVTPAEQFGWPDALAGFRAWRDALERRGVLVFELPIGMDDVRGFSAWDDRAPLIVANLSGVNPAARSFTLAHELGHLMTRQDSACRESGRLPEVAIERWCEEFGAALLMPQREVFALMRARGIAQGAASLADVTATMARFRVSGRAAALRLIDLGFASPQLYAAVLAAFKPAPKSDKKDRGGSLPRSELRLKQYGPGVVEAVLTALPPRDSLALLRLTVADVRKMPEGVTGGSTF